MKPLSKLILGLGCVIAALYAGLLAVGITAAWSSLDLGIVYLIKAAFTALFFLLVGIGAFLIGKRHVPITQKAGALISICSIVSVLSAVGLHRLVLAHRLSAAQAILKDVRQLDAAVDHWALDHAGNTNSLTTRSSEPPSAGATGSRSP